MRSPVLSVRDLVVEFPTRGGAVRAVDEVSFDVGPGETLGLIGESGSGKSLTVLSALGLAPRAATVRGEVHFGGRNLLDLRERELRQVRGGEIGMIFQEPMTSLNPTKTIGWQIEEAVRVHNSGASRKAARDRAVELLSLVGVPSARERLSAYPHEFSGGMRQRVLIAIAIANNPRLLLADEPTTALDVTIQAQILEVLEVAREETDASMVLVTHDLALVSEYTDQVAVMYAGKLAEVAPRKELFGAPRHPYTVGLLASLPHLDGEADRLAPITGQPPGLRNRPSGCSFHPRCRLRAGRERCVTDEPDLAVIGPDHRSACHFAGEVPSLIEELESEAAVRLAGGSR